jgi:hypothetical protein
MQIVYFGKDCFYIYIFRRIQMDWRDMGIRVSYQIKRKREKKRRR